MKILYQFSNECHPMKNLLTLDHIQKNVVNMVIYTKQTICISKYQKINIF